MSVGAERKGVKEQSAVNVTPGTAKSEVWFVTVLFTNL